MVHPLRLEIPMSPNRWYALLAAAYVVFLGVAFHGPDRWAANQNELGFFVDHFTFMAGLLYAAVHGPGRWLIVRRRAAAAAT